MIVGGLLLLTGCQGLTEGSKAAGAVGVGTSNLDFGTVTIGSSQTLTDTLSNHTSSPVTISSIQGLGPGFEVTGITLPVVLAAGQSTPFSVQFQPIDPGNPTTTISFNGQSAQPYASVIASGRAVTIGTLSPSPSQVTFGSTKVGSNQTSTVTLSNSGRADLTITRATLSGAGFSMSNLVLPLTLHAGNTTSATITFAPTGSGNFSGSVTFATTANQANSTVVLPFSGEGLAPGTLSPNPSSMAFGSIQVGSDSSQSETLTNTGGSAVTISQATASGTGFSVSGVNLPVTLAANQSVTFNAIFAPSSAGAASGALSIVSGDSNSPLSIPLSGTGLAPGALDRESDQCEFRKRYAWKQSDRACDGCEYYGGEGVIVSSAAATGSGFTFTGPNLPITLDAGQSTTFNAIFKPSVTGAASGTLTINSNAGNATLSVPLSGTGVAQGQLGSNPSTFSFGNVQVGTPKSLSGTLTNTGGN